MKLYELFVYYGLTEEEARKECSDLGYMAETVNGEIHEIGTCWDGNNRAKVFSLEKTEGYHISAQAGDVYEEDLPEGFEAY